MCFVDLKRSFDRVSRKKIVMEWALKKKGLAKVLVQAVMSLYKGSRTKVRVGSGTSKEFGSMGWCASRVCAITLILQSFYHQTSEILLLLLV